ncbi:MAG TPA: B12-binding domain-containing protein [Actinomycetes bacterium]|nr:B12-binding domain-containing protein [Actinomycetes bacterium]
MSRVCTEIVHCLYSKGVNEQQNHQATPDAGPGYLRIGQLAKRAGVSPELLRAWEQRYGLLQPTRTPGGFRLYSAADEARVRRMQSLVSGGLAAAQAARLVLSGGEPAPRTASPSTTTLDDAAGNLTASLDRLDEQAANTALDRLFAAYTVETVLQEVLIPYLHRLGERWETGEVSVAQEHFASNLIRGRLLGLAQGWGQGQGPGAILACVPGEQHELGLLAFGVALRRRGWRITYLGTDSPVDAVADIARSIAPAVVVLLGMNPERFLDHAHEIKQLAKQVPVVIAGPGATPEAARQTQTRVLDQDPVSAAETIDRDHSARGGEPRRS